MEVVTLLFLICMVVTLLFLAVVLLWPQPDNSAQADGDAGTGKPDGKKASPTTLEGALVAQLISGEITRAQYHAAVARLAARDDERSPLTVPGDDRPDACT
jgi:hypothetical protein